MTIPQSFLQELIARADVVEIVGRSVQLKKAGANFMGLCPFHDEKSPSFSVSQSKQFYHCFGCGKHGNAIGFLMEHAGMAFIDAVEDLAQQYGLQVPADDASPADRARATQERERQSTLCDVLERAGVAYRKLLKDAPAAIAYLKQRGVSGEVARQYGLGYAPEGWRTLAGVFPAYDDPLLVESGLVITSEDDDGKRYDRFRGRIMFPIRNVKGECIGFGGRVFDVPSEAASEAGGGGPKYLNSPETPVFSKGRELYGLYEARTALRERGYALVTEGYMDVVALAQLGFPNAVATLGTACTGEHVHKLFRFTEAVVFSFDGDSAGRRAARKALDAALPYANDVRSIKFLFLPREHDPDSFIRAQGAVAFARCVDDATPLSRFMLEAAREGCDLTSAEGRARLASQARPLWHQLPAGALKRQMLGEIAELVQLDSRELDALWGTASLGAWPRTDVAFAGARGRPGATREEPMPGAFPHAGSRWRSKPGVRGRVQPLSRADVAARALLSNLGEWEALTGELQSLLCALPGAHGALFCWLDAQLHEHGAQPWAALREGMRGLPFEALAERLLPGAEAAARAGETTGEAEPPTGTAADTSDSRRSGADLGSGASAELRDVLDRLLIERIKAEESQAVAAAGADPQALTRWRQLQGRRLALELGLRGGRSA
ncbi:MAG: DNA primase [Variovorax sp.]